VPAPEPARQGAAGGSPGNAQVLVPRSLQDATRGRETVQVAPGTSSLPAPTSTLGAAPPAAATGSPTAAPLPAPAPASELQPATEGAPAAASGSAFGNPSAAE